ncbi:MAG: hypothetical protein GXO79_16325 [Chlorobi bacterium]|nr:hypothetical protein [Chlorobiota bacterium]
MNDNYLENLIYTEYIHELQILEDSFDIIPEIKQNDDLSLSEELIEDTNKQDIELQDKEEVRKDELIKLDRNEKIAVEKIEDKQLSFNKNITDKNLLEFDYIKPKEVTKIDFPENEKHFFNDWIKLVSEKHGHIPVKNNKNGQLIDEFIDTNPKITPVQSEDKEITNFAEESVKETTEFFTETLATIYIKQKAYNKAILAYEKLSLKYPEKSIYFANQIKKIKKLIK